MWNSAKRWLPSLVVMLAILLAGVAGFTLGESSSGVTNRPPEADEADFDILDEIFEILDRDFVDGDRIDPSMLRAAAINGVLQSLGDPHTIYIDPQTVELGIDIASGMLQGIGAQVEQDPTTGKIVIVTPFRDSPAEAAGVRPGDIILAVDGESTDGWTVAQAVQRIRGSEGTEVTLTIEHPDGEIEDVTITRASIVIPTVFTRQVEDINGEPLSDIAYVELQQFTNQTVRDLTVILKEISQQGYNGLILDLRRNPGGLLNATVQVADMFLDSGIILTQVDQDGSRMEFEARPGGEAIDIPRAVLVGPGSASGAEVLAAALRDNNRAVLIGETTFGKGTVNVQRELSDGGALFVSVARWLTPSGELIQGVGLMPDISVDLAEDELRTGIGTQLFNAIDYLQERFAAQP